MRYYYLFILYIAILLSILSLVLVTLNPISKLLVPNFTDLDATEQQSTSLDFVYGLSSSEELELLTWPGSEEKLYTSDEISHLEDVRKIIITLEALGLISAILVIVHAGKSTREELKRFIKSFDKFMKRLFIILVILALLSAIFWNEAFMLFHKILFPQGNWAFPGDSGLIILFPEAFWQGMSLAFVCLYLLSLVILKHVFALIFRIYSKKVQVLHQQKS